MVGDIVYFCRRNYTGDNEKKNPPTFINSISPRIYDVPVSWSGGF